MSDDLSFSSLLVLRPMETTGETLLELWPKMTLRPAPNGYPIKLVRDGTPAMINFSGKSGALFYRAHTDDPWLWLNRKLGEEVTEYLIGRSHEELIDVVAVLDALLLLYGDTLEHAASAVASHPRGGFRNHVLMLGRHPEFDR